ncbi:MAG: proprotein convertase P-domain-containing protein [Lewinellaceae bacterium]|nr:proprotein convertase P-domain-containing protein [Lewinellaceae bacterium]
MLMLKKQLLLVFGALLALQAAAQTVFSDLAETAILQTSERRTAPQRYRTLQLDAAALQGVLATVPGHSNARQNADAQTILNLPLPEGGTARFRLAEAAVMHPDLQRRYPGIRSYTGYSADDPTALLKCNWTPYGFHAMLVSNRWGTVFVEPYRLGNTAHYIAYDKKDYLPEAKKHLFSCGTQPDAQQEMQQNILPAPVSARSNDGNMRQYRLALACTAEYAGFHGGDKSLALAAMVVSVNRINSVYEREFAVTLQLIPNTDTLIFLNALSDPYTNNNGGDMLDQNRTTCNNLIGSANYDIGHVFSTGGGGIASLASVCGISKAEGVTGQGSPIGDPFDIDYVAHEIGHQFSANHTQNNSCERNGLTAMEPGSGSTIMGYAGICSPNVQNNSHDYFHGVNVAEVTQFITQGAGNNCPLLIPNSNSAPTVFAGLSYTIPRSTPFVLRAVADDTNPDDVLTYCWEQMDNQTAVMPPNATSTGGPLFRTFPPDTLPERYFPRLLTLVTGASSTWEKLPAAGRTLKFRVTARDNNPAGGSTAQDDMVVTVAAGAGPFAVTQPNTATAWRSGEYRIITWNVANTDQTPVFCPSVNIRLSTDGGFTYPELLAAEVPNTGAYCIQVPDIETATARIKVEAANNIFFDISNANFQIAPPQAPSFSLCVAEPIAQVCLPQTFSTSMTTNALLGFSDPVLLDVSGLPAGSTALFSPNPVVPGQTVQMALEFPGGLPEGVLDITVRGIAGADTVTLPMNLTLVSNNFDNLSLLAPANGAGGLDQTPVLRWQAVPDADTYDVQLAASPTFANLVVERENLAVDSLKMPLLLEKGVVYYWRVRPKNACGTGKWVGPFAFATVVNTCSRLEAFDLPKNISANQAATIESKITVLANSIISDVNVAKIQGTHQFFRDLEVRLVSPAGTEVLLFKDKCGNFNGGFNIGFDDSALSEMTCPPPNNGTLFQPVSTTPLSILHGENTAGDWTLRVRDNVISSGGSISAFELELCANTTLFPPVIVNNNILYVEPGNNKVVTNDLLKAEDADNTDNELTYTLMTVPQHGQLQLFWMGQMLPGAQFTQADLNNGGLRYFHYGTNALTDQFCFAVTDSTGGLAQGCFTVQPLPLGTKEAHTLDFLLAPNPATETVRLAFGENLRSDTRVRLFDMAGRMVQTQVLAEGQTVLLLNVAGLPRGLYAVAVDNAGGSGMQKLVVR